MVPHQHRSVATVDGQEKGMVKDSTMPSSPFSRGMLWRRGGQVLVIGIPVVLLVLFVLYPLAAIILQSIFPQIFATSPSLVPSLDALKQVASDPQNYQALFNSLWLSGITAILAALLGTTLAILARRTDLPGRGLIDTLVWIVFFLNWFFSPVGVIFILSLKTFPFVYISVTAALQWLGSEFEDAARLVGARTWRAWLSINAPLLLPAILAAGLIAFAEALSDFGIAVTIAQNSNVTLVTYQIYIAINTAPVNFSQAFCAVAHSR
jgi:iron(III) transport system permease protein